MIQYAIVYPKYTSNLQFVFFANIDASSIDLFLTKLIVLSMAFVWRIPCIFNYYRNMIVTKSYFIFLQINVQK